MWMVGGLDSDLKFPLARVEFKFQIYVGWWHWASHIQHVWVGVPRCMAISMTWPLWHLRRLALPYSMLCPYLVFLAGAWSWVFRSHRNPMIMPRFPFHKFYHPMIMPRFFFVNHMTIYFSSLLTWMGRSESYCFLPQTYLHNYEESVYYYVW